MPLKHSSSVSLFFIKHSVSDFLNRWSFVLSFFLSVRKNPNHSSFIQKEILGILNKKVLLELIFTSPLNVYGTGGVWDYY